MVFVLIGFSARAQEISKEQANKIIAAYKRNIGTFMNLEICGSAFDGPVFMLKHAENYSLDRLVQTTPEQEAQLGLETFENSVKSTVVDDSRLSKVQNILTKLVAASSKPNAEYHLYIIKSEQINAFSTIGGYIYITTALLDFVSSKDELAFVLGHEMSHILLNHVVRKIKKIALINSIGQRFNFQQFSAVALNLNMNLSAPFDQIDEYDADRSSIEIVKSAGYDQMAFDSFFSKLEKYDRKDLLSRFTSTHPSSAHRRKCLNKLISQ